LAVEVASTEELPAETPGNDAAPAPASKSAAAPKNKAV
jgi:hypothetical protein